MTVDRDVKRRVRWFEAQRMTFIDDRLSLARSIRRKDIVDTFGVSEPTASMDLRTFMRMYPNAMKYNTSTKRYESMSIPIADIKKNSMWRNIKNQKRYYVMHEALNVTQNLDIATVVYYEVGSADVVYVRGKFEFLQKFERVTI